MGRFLLDFTRRAREVVDLEMAELKKARNGLGREFSRAVALILQCLKAKGKIVVTGIGKNLPIAEKISSTLASTGSTSVVLNPSQAMHGDLGVLNSGDVLLALSYSGESEELLALIPLVKRSGVRIVVFTGDKHSALARCSDVTVPIAVQREACPFNMAPTASTTATLAVGDALAMVLLEARGFRKEDYAKLHPGGIIGRTLLLRVSDIMRTGDRLAAVKRGAKVKDAVLATTRARSGSAAVLDGRGRVLGIFTDGDLRRAVAGRRRAIDLPIEKVMTPRPITLRADRLAIDVLRIFEQHNIDDVLIVDSKGVLVGAVDIQDLPKLKLM